MMCSDSAFECSGLGKGFSAPPQWLQNSGRFRGTTEDSRGLGDGVESCSYHQFGQKRAPVEVFPNCSHVVATPGASTIFPNRTGLFSPVFPGPPRFLHACPRRPAAGWPCPAPPDSGACSAGSFPDPGDRRAPESPAPARSPGSNRLTISRIARRMIGRSSYMLPLRSNILTSAYGIRSLRNAVIWRTTPSSRTSKSSFVRSVIRWPSEPTTVALIQTASVLALNVGLCAVACCCPEPDACSVRTPAIAIATRSTNRRMAGRHI